MNRRYIIGSGYHGHPGDGRAEFFKFWIKNVSKNSKPERIIVIADDDSDLPTRFGITRIPLSGNLGYCGDLLHGSKTSRFPGGPAVLMALAALAYCNETDLVYWEQDCLCFGDCIAVMYREIGEGGIIFGHNSQKVPCENCLFLLKHEFIPDFLATYAASEPETTPQNICEKKFQRWHQAMPQKWAKHTLRGGRDRPFPYDAPVFYGQQFTPEELKELQRRNLI